MRILLTVHQFLPVHSTGTEVIAHSTARGLRTKGHEVIIATGDPVRAGTPGDPRVDEYVYDAFSVFRFRQGMRPETDSDSAVREEFDNPTMGCAFGELLDAFRPDVVHFLHLGRLSASLIVQCTRRGIRSIFTATDFWAVCPLSQLRLPGDLRCAGPSADASNCIDHFLQLGALSSSRRHRMVSTIASRLPGASLDRIAALADWLPLSLSRPLRERVALRERAPQLRQALQHVGQVIAPSRLMLRILEANGIPATSVVHLPYGVDTTAIIRRVDRGSRPLLRIGYLGSVSEQKGLHVLVDAFMRLPANAFARLDIFGTAGRSGSSLRYVSELRRRVRGDVRIRLCGPYRHARVGRLLDDLDVVVVPSLWYENTPMVVYESFAAGCPVVASDVPGISEVVSDEVNGLLFAPGDSGALASCLARLIDDRPMVARLARATVPPLPLERHVSILETIYAAATPSALRCDTARRMSTRPG